MSTIRYFEERCIHLEAENARLTAALQTGVELLNDVQNGNKWWSAIAAFVEEYKEEEED